MESGYVLGPSELFTVFFVMVGPLEHLGPFAAVTKDMTQAQVSSLAYRSTAIIIPVVVILGLFGRQLLHEWHIPIPILQLTAGIIFAIMAFKLLLFHKKEEVVISMDDKNAMAPLTMALKIIINPYVCGTLIVLLASSQSTERTILIFTMLIINLILDGVALRFIRIFAGKAGIVILQILGSVLGVMQAALAITVIHFSLQMLK
ncbi:MarC family protein [Bdellovibrio sp. HCB209]|uniref:MarC family protein n=1 Tax=Bdellovibrio sp. HCB209 TaxID=3394354 RepID=UPI0039B48B83